MVSGVSSPKIVAVIMTYNCAHLLPKAYDQIPKELVDEVIVVDDGSTDGSCDVAQQLGIMAYCHEHSGYGGNLKEGLRQALKRGADYIVEVHGDGQFDPSALKPALAFMQRGIQFILGSRFVIPGRARENGMPLIRYSANRFLSFFDRLVLGLPFTEFHTGFRIYSRTMLQRIPWQRNSDDYLFSFQIIAQAAYAKFSVAEVPVDANYREEHTSHSIAGASVYAVRTFSVLLKFLLAKWGIYTSPLFFV